MQTSQKNHMSCDGAEPEQIGEVDVIKKINFKHEPTEHLQFKISKDFKLMIFSDVNENFIVEEHRCFYVQKKLDNLVNRYVNYIEEDDEGHGFFLICSQKFDNKITVVHSEKMNF